MKKRILASVAAFAVAFLLIADCTPKAKAVVPIGIVQSALASYVSSTGYKLYNDQGTGQQLLGSLSDLYDTWLNSSAGQALSQWTLTHIAAIDAVLQDKQGNIVVKKTAADVWQQFADWIQSNYSVPTDGTHVQLIQSTPGGFSFPDYSSSGTYTVSSVANPKDLISFGFSLTSYSYRYSGTVPDSINSFLSQYSNRAFALSVKNISGSTSWGVIRIYAVNWSNPFVVKNYTNTPYLNVHGTWSGDMFVLDDVQTSTASWSGHVGYRLWNNAYWEIAPFNAVPYGGVQGLAVSIGQTIVDIADRADDGQALVFDVGATAGTTPAELADIVATGAKAGTLDPAVSVVSEDVIDTPAQPYPDVDSLGLPSLGAALTSRFPFCIPWDFVDVVQLLNAEPAAPNIRIDLFPSAFKAKVGVTGDTSFAFDLSQPQYAKIGLFCRWGALISFCFGLVLLTKRMIWTA